ncbi:MAG TPA: YdcH family protein [Sphingomicrobium sp.]
MRPQFFRLLEMHQRIDETLRRELQRRWPDPFKVSELKKRKLRVKDRLFRLTPHLSNA